jgi:hypothetical protein
MQIYTENEDISNLKHEELGYKNQNCHQFDNRSITVFRALEDLGDLKAGMVLQIDDWGSGSGFNISILETEDIREFRNVGISQYLDNRAEVWATNGQDDQVVELCRWGLRDIDDWRYDGEDACNVLVKECYFGYMPIDRVKDEHGEVLEFPDSATAQAWIDEQEKKRYSLSNNEAGRPQYVVVAAL